MIHSIRFERHRLAGVYRATCTCGWTEQRRDLEALQTLSATHDLGPWEPVDVSTEKVSA